VTAVTIVPIISAVVLSIVEIVKRVIPDVHRTWANPILALILAVIAAYLQGGAETLIGMLTQAVVGAAGAVGAYSLPKALGSRLGID